MLNAGPVPWAADGCPGTLPGVLPLEQTPATGGQAWACTPPPTSTTVTAGAIQASRARVLTAAYSTHPERFVRKPPVPSGLPATSWINPPQEKEGAAQ